MCESLRASGYNVLQARRGDHAIDLAEEYKASIHLMIGDMVLPDMSGPSIVQIQALHPEAKVLFVSGYAEVPVAQKLISGGAVFMQKPVSRRYLLRKVDEMLHPPLCSVHGKHSVMQSAVRQKDRAAGFD